MLAVSAANSATVWKFWQQAPRIGIPTIAQPHVSARLLLRACAPAAQ